MIDHLNAYALIVSDVDKCLSFYTEKLGFALKDREKDFAYLVFGGGPGLALVSIESAVNLISETQIRPKEKALHRNYFAVFVDVV
ncbi:MAG: VOC family protein [Nitrososphaerales archaeon]